MLTPSESFSAKEIRFLQNEASEWIKKVNAEIIKAAENGQSRVHISVYNNDKKDYTEFYNAPFALIEHFKNRGFNCEMAGQSNVLISWEEIKPAAL
jgi:hypothetical protein